MDAPVSGQADPRASRYIVDHLKPGTTIERRVRVVNKADRELLIEIYPAAATIDSQRFLFGADRTANELTGWISLDIGRVRLPAGGQQDVLTTIRVPQQASKGERYGMIWAASASDPGSPGNVRQIHRVGVRIYLDIGAGGAPIADFDIGTMTATRNAADLPSVTIEVINTGERALDMTGSALLTDGPAGLGAGPFEVDQGTTLAPGQAGTVTIGFPRELPNGPWTIEADLNSGAVSRSATASITFPEPGQTAAISGSWTPTPWLIIGVSVVIGLLILLLLGIIARRNFHRTRVSR